MLIPTRLWFETSRLGGSLYLSPPAPSPLLTRDPWANKGPQPQRDTATRWAAKRYRRAPCRERTHPGLESGGGAPPPHTHTHQPTHRLARTHRCGAPGAHMDAHTHIWTPTHMRPEVPHQCGAAAPTPRSPQHLHVCHGAPTPHIPADTHRRRPRGPASLHTHAKWPRWCRHHRHSARVAHAWPCRPAGACPPPPNRRPLVVGGGGARCQPRASLGQRTGDIRPRARLGAVMPTCALPAPLTSEAIDIEPSEGDGGGRSGQRSQRRPL